MSYPESHKETTYLSQESHASLLESSMVDNEEPCSSSKASLKPEKVLRLLQDNAPPGFKYCLTMVPRETDSMEKVLKSRMHRWKDNDVPAPKRHKISNYDAVLTNKDYQKKIAGAKRKDDEKEEKKEVRNVKRR